MKNWGWVLVTVSVGLLLCFSTAAAQQSASGRLFEDCAKCHADETREVARKGGAHGEFISCDDCHWVHPKKGAETEIASCSACHDPADQDHYALPRCIGCHSPHAPLDLEFSALTDARKACSTCHPDVATAAKKARDAHSELDCNTCHLTHGDALGCAECHAPQDSAHYVLSDCTGCHPPHQPSAFEFSSLRGAKNVCLSCHEDIAAGRGPAAVGGGHVNVACTTCHSRHSSDAPSCTNCHPTHDKSITAQDCSACHKPHNPVSADPWNRVRADWCTACHQETLADFDSESSIHLKNLACSDCHSSHPYAGAQDTVAACADCHSPDTSEHYTLPNCSRCHPPHAPLDFDFSSFKDVRATCASCHPGATKGPDAVDGAHADVACNTCHAQHNEIPACTDCHSPHNDAMTEDNCRACHGAHKPVPVRYFAGVSQSWCAACHEETVTTLEQKGGAHQEQVGCYRCHQQHPPLEGSTPTACTQCHPPEKDTHFTLDNCLNCHQPHAPHERSADAPTDLSPACFTCHPGVEEQIISSSGSHSEIACYDCHQQHGHRPLCLDCHEPHSEEMTQGSCQECHGPHDPENVAFESDIAGEHCAACHSEIHATLTELGGGHSAGMGCADCHQSHPPAEDAIPACADCHAAADNPHYELPNCSGCHPAHAPLDQLWDQMSQADDACLSCHDDPMAKPDQIVPSPHAQMSCGACHQSHTEILSCLECHEPHANTMTVQDCITCHDPHLPSEINHASGPQGGLCAACHQQIYKDVKNKGAAHREALMCVDCHQQHPAAGCTDCHADHPQSGMAASQDCATCHSPQDNAHFVVKGCRDCHSPHTPLEMDLTELAPVRPACLSCHRPVGDALASLYSAHRTMDCSVCHPAHGRWYDCLRCHSSHGPEMTAEDCSDCHEPHRPTDIAYTGEVSDQHCATCHQDVAQTLTDKGGPHRDDAGCAACHPQHLPEGKETIAPCLKCHPRLGKQHYTLEPCIPCHAPHEPAKINLAAMDEVRPACATCHQVIDRLMRYNRGSHSELDCNQCHFDHTGTQACLDCHSPHDAEMTQEDCSACHNAHAPQNISFDRRIDTALCSSCHQDAISVLENQGGAHSSAVGCYSCHAEHPPKGEETIADCTNCHESGDHPHFAVGNCRDCHSGHAPRQTELDKAAETRQACVSCHKAVARDMEKVPTLHAELDCANCHLQHKQAQQCTECHQPHTDDMGEADCMHCHAPHTPTQIYMPADIPGSFCRNCHGEVTATLAASEAKHSELDCLECHQGDHGNAISCDTCHGWPHESGLHKKFPDCLRCHRDPHNLANWSK
jgi:predicted CXXCH cytochrome family protein